MRSGVGSEAAGMFIDIDVGMLGKMRHRYEGRPPCVHLYRHSEEARA